MQTDKLMILAGDKILKQVGKNLDGIDVTQYADLLFAGAKAEKQRRQLQQQVEQARKTSQLHKDNHLAAEKTIERVCGAVGTHNCSGRDCIGIYGELTGATRRCSDCENMRAAIKGEGDG